jgi:hypothetical protein
MSVAKRKGAPGKADTLFSLIVRSRGRCEYPGCKSQGPFDTAHNILRDRSGTRCLEDNAWCMCRTHHRLIDRFWHEKQAVTAATIGLDRYTELLDIAENYRILPITSATFWREEVLRLKARCAELGLSDRRAA